MRHLISRETMCLFYCPFIARDIRLKYSSRQIEYTNKVVEIFYDHVL